MFSGIFKDRQIKGPPVKLPVQGIELEKITDTGPPGHPSVQTCLGTCPELLKPDSDIISGFVKSADDQQLGPVVAEVVVLLPDGYDPGIPELLHQIAQGELSDIVNFEDDTVVRCVHWQRLYMT